MPLPAPANAATVAELDTEADVLEFSDPARRTNAASKSGTVIA